MLKLMIVFKSGAIQVIVVEPKAGFDFSKDTFDFYERLGKNELRVQWLEDKLSGGFVYICYNDVSFIKASHILKSDWNEPMSARTRQEIYGTAV